MTSNERGAGGDARPALRTITSLQINVSTLLQEPIGSLRLYEIERAHGAGLHADVSGRVRLLRTDQSLLATVDAATSVSDLCGGCLSEVELGLDFAFDEEFWPDADAFTGAAIEPPPERIGFAVVDGLIDLSEAVRQYVEMNRPMSPRCGADCPGLPVDEPQEAPADPRWAALAALKLESEGD